MTDTVKRVEMQSVIRVQRGDTDMLEVVGAGAPGTAMLECLVVAAPRTHSAKRAGTPGMRRFLNAAMRSADGYAQVIAYGESGNDVATVTCERVN